MNFLTAIFLKTYSLLQNSSNLLQSCPSAVCIQHLISVCMSGFVLLFFLCCCVSPIRFFWVLVFEFRPTRIILLVLVSSRMSFFHRITHLHRTTNLNLAVNINFMCLICLSLLFKVIVDVLWCYFLIACKCIQLFQTSYEHCSKCRSNINKVTTPTCFFFNQMIIIYVLFWYHQLPTSYVHMCLQFVFVCLNEKSSI